MNAGKEIVKLKLDLDMFAGKIVSLYKDDKKGEPQLVTLKVKESGKVQLEILPFAERKRAAQGVDPLLDLPHGVAQLGAVGEFDLLFREVEFEFQLRGEVQQFFAQGVERCGITPAHLVGGERVRRPRGRGDDVGHGFGLWLP